MGDSAKPNERFALEMTGDCLCLPRSHSCGQNYPHHQSFFPFLSQVIISKYNVYFRRYIRNQRDISTTLLTKQPPYILTSPRFLSASPPPSLFRPADMAVVLGNLALLIDAASPPITVPDRKPRPPAVLDVLLNLSRREPHANSYLTPVVAATSKGFESEPESCFPYKVAARGKSSSKVDAVGFGSGSTEEESNGNGNGNGNGNEVEEGGGELDWEKQMRKRVKEIEEMRELEKKAEELQSRGEAEESGGDEGNEETEEEKKMRVRKELEKV